MTVSIPFMLATVLLWVEESEFHTGYSVTMEGRVWMSYWWQLLWGKGSEHLHTGDSVIMGGRASLNLCWWQRYHGEGSELPTSYTNFTWFLPFAPRHLPLCFCSCKMHVLYTCAILPHFFCSPLSHKYYSIPVPNPLLLLGPAPFPATTVPSSGLHLLNQ